jgi:tetratricopeptide (TPR) repeat protein
VSKGRHAWIFLFASTALMFCGASQSTCAQSVKNECVGPKSLQSQLESQPTANTFNALGNYYVDHKEYDCAALAFKSSLKLEPNSAQTHYSLGLSLLAKGTMERAITELEKSLNLEPKSISTIDLLARAYMAAQRYTAAIALLKDAPPNESLQMDLVMAYSNSGDNASALQLLQLMQQSRPNSSVPHFGKGSIYTQQRQYENAAKEFQEALRLNPKDDTSRSSYIRVLMMEGKPDAALPYAQEFQRDHPHDFDACYLLGAVERALGKYAEAKPLLEQAVKIKPEHYLARYNLGITYAKTNEPTLARIQLEKAVQLDPSSPEAHFQLAAVLRALSLNDEAQAQTELYQSLEAERLQKDVAGADANQARALMQQGNAKDAVNLYKAAIEKDSTNSHLYYDFAIALDRAGDPKAAQQAISKSIELDPRFAAAHNQMGLLLLQANLPTEAEKEFKTAISLDPREVEAHNNLGVLYGQQDKYADAASLFRSAIANNPGYAPSYINLAVVEASRAQFNEAEAALKKALQIEPENAETKALLSKVQGHLEQKSNAQP